eukprot:gnl/MRDRNA2_/MRDRNA2_83448_c0_seq1.p1 gnl/MRDRNA2_/MRDRNA2_83448_c0~~gnl/MRDRNA2_/MRDRNA2_83448_c0_seq1.p1  ORF type:complete len:469 (-),score=115.28 gnl/MRDRNA2_/MRDRNA2_83448_c0_seq1:173-1579(-)
MPSISLSGSSKFFSSSSKPAKQYEIDDEEDDLKTLKVGDRVESLNNVTVRERESTDTAKVGYFPKSTPAFVLEFGQDQNRIRCEFPTKNGVRGWISVTDKNLGKALLRRMDQGRQRADTQPSPAPENDSTQREEAAPQGTTSSGGEPQDCSKTEAMKTLWQMGFKSVEKNRAALRDGGSLQGAIDILTAQANSREDVLKAKLAEMQERERALLAKAGCPVESSSKRDQDKAKDAGSLEAVVEDEDTPAKKEVAQNTASVEKQEVPAPPQHFAELPRPILQDFRSSADSGETQTGGLPPAPTGFPAAPAPSQGEFPKRIESLPSGPSAPASVPAAPSSIPAAPSGLPGPPSGLPPPQAVRSNDTNPNSSLGSLPIGLPSPAALDVTSEASLTSSTRINAVDCDDAGIEPEDEEEEMAVGDQEQHRGGPRDKSWQRKPSQCHGSDEPAEGSKPRRARSKYVNRRKSGKAS